MASDKIKATANAILVGVGGKDNVNRFSALRDAATL